MGDVINLRRARKQIADPARERQARSNRAKFGRTKSEKTKDAAEREKLRTILESSKREP